MKDSTKLLLSAVGLFLCGLVKAILPTMINKGIDTGSLFFFLIISIVVAILGCVKRVKEKGKPAKKKAPAVSQDDLFGDMF